MIGILAANDWDAAVRDLNNPNTARQLAAKIISERSVLLFDEMKNQSRRPEQVVMQLQQLRIGWADFAIITMWAIPELIPLE